MYEHYHYNPIDPTGPFVHWPPAEPPAEDGLPDRVGCLMAIASWIITIILLAILCAFTSCRSTRTVVVELQDSTSTHVHTHTVFVPDTILVPLPTQTVYHVTPDTASHLETDYAASDAAVRDGMLHHSLTTKPTPVPVPVTHKETTRDSIVYREREVPVPVPVVQEVEKPLSRWQQLRLSLANIMLIALALAALVWALKKRAWWLRLFK